MQHTTDTNPRRNPVLIILGSLVGSMGLVVLAQQPIRTANSPATG